MSEDQSRAWVETAQRARLSGFMLDAVLDPAAASPLAADDQLFNWEKCSAWTLGYLKAASEHLAVWADLIVPLDVKDGDKAEIRTRPCFALGRSALESAAQAVWVLTPNRSEERVSRHLGLVSNDLRQMSLGLKADGNTEGYVVTQERLSLMEERLPAELDFSKIKSFNLKFIDLVRNSAAKIGADQDDLEAIWRFASAGTHGKSWFLVATSSFEVGEEYEPGHFRAWANPDAAELTRIMDAATKMTQYGVDRFIVMAGLDLNAIGTNALKRLWSITPKKPGA
ncbi:MAG TPA: hypothetical protein VMF31_08105 [Solirubrobacterales bacterium]|nr:hypothetical protein [Solirubrobacterales bacterium]